jgi:thiol-disulfide isomerase/thioredoxin
MKDNLAMNPPNFGAARRHLLLGAGAAAAAAGVGVAMWRFQPQTLTDAARHLVWQQQFDTPLGEGLNMSAFQGKPLLLNFWATWCPPCVDELPMLAAFWRENAANQHQVVALAIDQAQAVRRFLERQPLGFPIGLAGLAGADLAKSLGNAAGGLPFTVFFRADGSIWRQKTGQLTVQDLAQWRDARV